MEYFKHLSFLHFRGALTSEKTILGLLRLQASVDRMTLKHTVHLQCMSEILLVNKDNIANRTSTTYIVLVWCLLGSMGLVIDVLHQRLESSIGFMKKTILSEIQLVNRDNLANRTSTTYNACQKYYLLIKITMQTEQVQLTVHVRNTTC